ncbi:MAG: hypothetical protein HY711_06600 [Candidatus Melainabacteria bacterium]|nr:hypothetical protein [Candidatus Melainabacteria bacterium]
MNKLRLLIAVVVSTMVTLVQLPVIGALTTVPQTMAQLHSDKLKQLYRRAPRAKELVPRIEQRLHETTSSTQHSYLLKHIEDQMTEIIMSSSNLSEERLEEAVNFLAALAGPIKQPLLSELAPLQERYAKLCELMDDQVLVKDFDAVLPLHDKFIQYTSAGLWDKDTIAQQLDRLETFVKRAPEIPYGRLELLHNLQNKRLLPPSSGCYLGIFPQDHAYLSTNRLSVGVLEESTGATVQLETTDMVIQGPDGQLMNLNSANHPLYGQPFSPPLTLWLKCRLLEGRIPTINFRLLDESIEECYRGLSQAASNLLQNTAAAKPHKVMSVQDILDGTLDEYFKHNLKLIASLRTPTLVGLFTNFDKFPAATAFGADGRTPYYLLVDPKLSQLPEDKQQAEIKRRLARGAFVKDSGIELRKHYGDPNVPDGPERVRDAWKHFHLLIATSSGTSVSFYSTSGAFHGNKKSSSFVHCSDAGIEDWNKLEYYWPGNGVLEWIGVSAVGTDPIKNPQGFNIIGSVDHFVHEVESSNWHSTPIILCDLAPHFDKDPLTEPEWLATCFADVLPHTYPNIKAFFIDYPSKVTLWPTDAHATFRKYVSSNSYYKQTQRLLPVGDFR